MGDHAWKTRMVGGAARIIHAANEHVMNQLCVGQCLNCVFECFFVDNTKIFGCIICTAEGFLDDALEVGALFSWSFTFAQTTAKFH